MFQIRALRVVRQESDTVVRLDVGLRGMIVVGGRVYRPDARSSAHVTTLASHVYLPLLVAFSLALAWPAGSLREWAARIGLALGLCFPIVALDVPLVLYAELWQDVRDALVPGQFSLSVAWKDFLQGGGRLGLGLAAAALAVLGAGRLGRTGPPERKAGAGETLLRLPLSQAGR